MDPQSNNRQESENEERMEQRKKSKISFGKRKRKPSRYRKQNTIIQNLAKERIEYLMEMALQIHPNNLELANRYVDLARKYSMSSKILIPIKYKKYICHNCKKLMIPGVTSRHRIQSRKKRGSRYIITCLHCQHIQHFYFKQKSPKKKKPND